MGYEIVLATVVGSISSIITILLWQRGTWKKMELEHSYNIRRFKLGKKYKLQEQELPKKQSKNLLDQLMKLDKGTISKALEFLSPEEEYDEEGGDLVSTLKNLVSNNPDLVNQFLKGLGEGSTKKEPEQKFNFE